jgi:hypothetical protein
MFAPPSIFRRARFQRQITQIAAFASIAAPVQVTREGHGRFRFSTSPSPRMALRRPGPPILACTHDHTGTPTNAEVPVSDTRWCRAPGHPPCLPRGALGQPPPAGTPRDIGETIKNHVARLLLGRRPLSQRPRPPDPASKRAWTASSRVGARPDATVALLPTTRLPDRSP